MMFIERIADLESTTAYVNACHGDNTDNPTEITREDLDCFLKALIEQLYPELKNENDRYESKKAKYSLRQKNNIG
jgi:hypothetical protein